jgi:poly-gamma-glutamate synthesis protein (capsule biosynthesis protein)
MNSLFKNNSKKLIKILSLLAVLSTCIFLIFSFYSLSKNEKSYSIPFRSKKTQEEDKITKMLFFGDLMLDRHVGEKIKQNGVDWLFKKLAGEENRFLQGLDLISANLEGAIADNGAHYNPTIAYDFSFSPEIISNLKKYNFNFFNLANNHFSDQGERGIIETRKNLDELKLNYAGCKDGQIGDCSGKIIEISGEKIGLAGFSSVYSLIDSKKAEEIVKKLADETDLVIVNFHWGVEYEHKFNQIQQKLAYALIDAGADIIIGHHPHVVQGLEIYKNKPIFYSLGNFVFDQYFSSDTQEGLAVGINTANQKIELYLFPMKSKLSQTELMTEKEKEVFLDKLASWSNLENNFKEQIKQGKFTVNY